MQRWRRWWGRRRHDCGVLPPPWQEATTASTSVDPEFIISACDLAELCSSFSTPSSIGSVTILVSVTCLKGEGG